ncbi:MAG: glutathione S-transferase family protein [Holosporales bacterium]|jgi:glutathione S-transferase|nr:glutathione S-transferase family protein [Holosporales bacterium]
MRKLYHYPLCGFSRAARFLLAEKRLDCALVYETPWTPSDALLDQNLFGTLPVLIDINGVSVFGNSAIREYLNETYPEIEMIGVDHVQRAEVRRLADWFDIVFYRDVYFPLIREKILKRFSKDIDKVPDPASVRSACSRLSTHMDYVSWLIDRRNWLAGKDFSIADIHAASLISVLDYLGVIVWDKYEVAKSWYAKIKSRPGFRSILSDNLPQVPPAPEYSNPDF